MSALAEPFARFADVFSEPILLVSSDGHICAANRGARACTPVTANDCAAAQSECLTCRYPLSQVHQNVEAVLEVDCSPIYASFSDN